VTNASNEAMGGKHTTRVLATLVNGSKLSLSPPRIEAEAKYPWGSPSELPPPGRIDCAKLRPRPGGNGLWEDGVYT